jgi:hypothetical protein
MSRGNALLRWDFVPEWSAIAGLALVDAVWAAHIHLTFTATPADFLVPGLTLALMAGARLFAFRRASLTAEYFALFIAASIAVCALSYLCLASSTGLADQHLAAMDRLLGFDWLAGYRFVQAHPALSALLGLAYGSLVYQGLYLCLLLGLMDQKQRLREMFWLFLLTALLACAGTLCLPALGPSKYFNIETTTGFVPVMQHLLSGRDMSFALGGMTGVVSFPSFHTSMALAYAWAFRKCGIIGVGMAALNIIMLCAVPFFGGHYLVDMIAGAATMLLSLAVVKTGPALWSRLRGGRVAVAQMPA